MASYFSLITSAVSSLASTSVNAVTGDTKVLSELGYQLKTFSRTAPGMPQMRSAFEAISDYTAETQRLFLENTKEKIKALPSGKLAAGLVSGDIDEAWYKSKLLLKENMNYLPSGGYVKAATLYTLGDDKEAIKAFHDANLQLAKYAGMAIGGPMGAIVGQYCVNNITNAIINKGESFNIITEHFNSLTRTVPIVSQVKHEASTGDTESSGPHFDMGENQEAQAAFLKASKTVALRFQSGVIGNQAIKFWSNSMFAVEASAKISFTVKLTEGVEHQIKK
jgi:hypothetical protein